MTDRYLELTDQLNRKIARQLSTRVRETTEANQWHQRRLERIEESHAAEQARFEARRAKLDLWRHDPVVLVRVGPGPRPEVYHDITRTCGYLAPTTTVETQLLGEALERALRPCERCRPAHSETDQQAS